MREIISQISEYVWGVWRFRWISLAAVWMVAIVGWVVVALTPEQYLASARVHVDTNTVLRPLLRGLAVQPDVDERIALMSKTMLSRPNLEKLMRMADLDLAVRNEEQKEKVMDDLKKSISLSGDRRNASLYTVTFKNEDREVAKKVVESMLTVFVESALGDKRKDSSGAQDFLNKQIADYEQRLTEAEARLSDFKQRNSGLLPSEMDDYYKRLEFEREQLASAELQLKAVKNRRDELQRQIEGEEPVFLSSQIEFSPQVVAIDKRITAMQNNLDSLLLRYTDLHPSVIQIKDMLGDLEKEKSAAIAAIKRSAPDQYASLNDNPVYQQMRSMLSETEASEAELSTRAQEYNLRVQSLEDKINQIPLLESEHQQLTRDYDVISRQHQTLLSRRESARISGNVEQAADDVTFRIIDPPFAPLKPNEPNKLLMNVIVLVGAIGTGLGIGLLMSLLKPVVSTRATLNKITGFPVLGSVQLIRSPLERRQQLVNTMVFACVALSLVVLFVGISVFQGMDMQLANLVTKMEVLV
ncbi:XrtA system polysaccharide chain length determinant [Neptunomonas sp.]|uniref:XrtA system polysaccharide chain length determinant n=1 Tax=Neptunomonas sp. TaxID=1971898 RepID=UPI0035192C3D